MKYPHADAMKVATALAARLGPMAQTIAIAGSLRRRRPLVGDIEILYVPRLLADLLGQPTESMVDLELAAMLKAGQLARRLSIDGSSTWGQNIKLAEHLDTGIPVDFFATTAAAWFNTLVVRTGPKESNIAVATAARRKGWLWHTGPYDAGFTDRQGQLVPVHSEADVFRLVGLPYRPPEARF